MSTPEGDCVIRLVNPRFYDHNAPKELRVQNSALPSDDYTPKPGNKGASCYLCAKLEHGFEDLVAKCPKYADWGFAEIPVSELAAIGVTIAHSPDEGDIAGLDHAHYSLIGIVNRTKRSDVVKLITKYLKKEPTPPK